jgi:hypothetical protein
LGHAEDALEQTTIIGGETVAACSEPASIDELTIEFPEVTTPDACESNIISRPPCQADFLAAEYQSLPHHEAIQASCVACPGVEAPTEAPTDAPTVAPTAAPVTHPILQNGDFETGFATSNYEYTHAVTGWTAAGGTVAVRTNNGPWGGIAARSGHYLLALQSRGASVKQMVSGHMVGHTYKLVWGNAQRTNSPGGRNAILRVTANGAEMMNEVVSSLSMERREYTYTAHAEDVEIKFENLVAAGDQTVFIDGVELTEA